MSKKILPVSFELPNLVKEIKARIQQAQARAVLAVNAELVRLYWDIGRMIEHRQQQEGWGAAVIPRLAREPGGGLPGGARRDPVGVHGQERVEKVRHVAPAHGVHQQQRDQLAVRFGRPPDRPEVRAEAIPAARDVVKLPLDT